MSQAATLYRISKSTFAELEKSNNENTFDISLAISHETFEGSFMAIEFLLAKNQTDLNLKLIGEIFNPQQTLGIQDIESLISEEQFDFFENEIGLQYFDNLTVSSISNLLDKVTDLEFESRYDSEDLNENGIYPEVWHDDNSEDQAFNKRHLVEDFAKLKRIFKQAKSANDYVLVSLG